MAATVCRVIKILNSSGFFLKFHQRGESSERVLLEIAKLMDYSPSGPNAGYPIQSLSTNNPLVKFYKHVYRHNMTIFLMFEVWQQQNEIEQFEIEKRILPEESIHEFTRALKTIPNKLKESEDFEMVGNGKIEAVQKALEQVDIENQKMIDHFRVHKKLVNSEDFCMFESLEFNIEKSLEPHKILQVKIRQEESGVAELIKRVNLESYFYSLKISRLKMFKNFLNLSIKLKTELEIIRNIIKKEVKRAKNEPKESKDFAKILISFHLKYYAYDNSTFKIFDKDTNDALDYFYFRVRYPYDLLDHQSFEPIGKKESDKVLEARFQKLSNDDETIIASEELTTSHLIYTDMSSLNDGLSFEPLENYVKNNIQSNSLKIVLNAYISACYQLFSQVCM